MIYSFILIPKQNTAVLTKPIRIRYMNMLHAILKGEHFKWSGEGQNVPLSKIKAPSFDVKGKSACLENGVFFKQIFGNEMV